MDLNQVTLPSTDLATAVAFYRQLGLTLIVDSVPEYVRFELPFGNATLSLHRVDRVNVPTGVTIYFECEDLDARVAVLEAAGIAFTAKPADTEWLWREAYVSDPDGNVICFFRAGVNRKNPPWRVK